MTESPRLAAAATAPSKLLKCARSEIHLEELGDLHPYGGGRPLLAIAYIVYRILDLLARRKFAQSYAAWEPDLEQYYRKHSSHPQPAGCHTDSETQDKTKESAKS